MKQKVLLITLITLLCAVLFGIYISSAYVMFILFYTFIFIFMFFRSLFSARTVHSKIIGISVYLAIMVFQITFTTLITFSSESAGFEFVFFKMISLVIILGSPLTERVFFTVQDTAFFMPSVEDFTTVTYAQLVYDKDKIVEALNIAQKAGYSFSKENLSEVLEFLPQQNSFRYINDGSLTDDYFKAAESSLTDEYIYIVLTDTGSAASEIISVFTQKQYNHVSLSFDSDLQTIISYNGGGKIYPPGLNHEMLDSFNKKSESSIMVYKLKTTRMQKNKIIEKVKEINREGSAYNLLGLVFKYSFKPNIMFCSQFVYQMLKYAGLAYFEKKSTEVRPTDLVELDYYRRLGFAYEVKLNG